MRTPKVPPPALPDVPGPGRAPRRPVKAAAVKAPPVNLYVRVPARTHLALVAGASDADLSLAAYTRQLIEKALEQ